MSEPIPKLARSIRLDADLDYMIPVLIARKDMRETRSEFIRIAARERFARLAGMTMAEYEKEAEND